MADAVPEFDRLRQHGDSRPEDDSRQSAAKKIVRIGLANSYLFKDDRGTAYAAIGPDGARTLVPVASSAYSRFLSQRFYLQENKVPSSENISAARNILAAEAIFNGQCHTLHNRFARHDGALWIDLADRDQRAVRITPYSWEIVSPPVLFRRFRSQAPLPEPVAGGNLKEELLRFVNVIGDDQILVFVWLVAAVLGHIPRPILMLHGAQGAAKTTTAKVLRRLTDPSAAPTNRLSQQDDELALALETNAVPVFDNLTRISPGVADLLCQAVTGGGHEKRELFTDSDQIVYSFKRAIIATGINIPSHAPDLLDRCLLIGVERIAPEQRKLEEDFWAEFDAAAPRIFGAMLETLRDAFSIYSEVRQSGILPQRMADFTIWGAAIAQALGYEREAFLRAYHENVKGQTEEVLESDPVARIIRERFASSEFDGSASELLKDLKAKYPDETSKKDFPDRADRLSRRLRVLETTLADVGIQIKRDRDRSARRIVIRPVKAPPEASQASQRHKPAQDAAPGRDASVTLRVDASHQASRENPHQQRTRDAVTLVTPKNAASPVPYPTEPMEEAV